VIFSGHEDISITVDVGTEQARSQKRQMWREHPNIILKENHFAALRINWTI
jgi:predicted enzyme involved in methoxymalonyl-ACP biosynthesis